uniref:Dihydrolipoyllysine-residue succinyltransferase component of 2-oxoglutarate dehydrogenase complex, mitochondrial n=1 Tax=Sander lucioperca TaxID=283035 RepID=A0A8C9XWZ3_SANLU
MLCSVGDLYYLSEFITFFCFVLFFRKSDPRSNVFQIQYFRTSVAYRDEVVTVKTPAFAESVTEGDVRWEKAVGDTVAEDEVVCEIETDKTSVQVPSPAAGVIEELLVPDGGKVEGGTALFKLRKGGRYCIFIENCATLKIYSNSWERSLSNSDNSCFSIAQRLKEAQNTCAMLTTFNEVDMSNITELRKTYKDAFLKKHNIKLGFMSAFVKAAAYALADQPAVNAVIDDTTKEIVYRDYVDISVAVATPKGLVVPVIRSVEGMNFTDIEKAINLLGEKARKNELAVEDMDGGTFTISNGGVFGSMFGTPIINPPQSAILGMHGIFDRPVAVGGKVEIRPMMYVALTYDHRLIDGREAVTFLRKIKSVVEDPRVLLLDM